MEQNAVADTKTIYNIWYKYKLYILLKIKFHHIKSNLYFRNNFFFFSLKKNEFFNLVLKYNCWLFENKILKDYCLIRQRKHAINEPEIKKKTKRDCTFVQCVAMKQYNFKKKQKIRENYFKLKKIIILEKFQIDLDNLFYVEKMIIYKLIE